MIDLQRFIHIGLKRRRKFVSLEDSNLSNMLQPAATVPATSVPKSPSNVPQPSPTSTPSPILEEVVIPLVSKL
jgi:hypothetical protein